MTREKDVFHWFGCLLTRQTKSPKGQGTCQIIHIPHETFFCIISFGNVLKTLGAWGGGKGAVGPQANISRSLQQSAQAFGCRLSVFPLCIHSLSFCSSLAGSLPGFYPASKRLYLTFLSLVFVFDCQLTSFLNVKTVYCLLDKHNV